MTDRIPLIVNSGAAQIQELPAGDNLSITGNIAANYFIGNGSQLTGIASTGNVDFSAVASNIIPTGNSVYNLGNAAHQWNDLYLSNATIYMNNTPISLTAGNVLTVNGADVVTTAANGVTSLGNIGFTGDAIYDLNGMIIENADLSHAATAAVILPANGNTTAPVQINNTYGNITLGTGPSSTITSTWKFDTNGALNLPVPGTVRGNLVNIVSDNFAQLQWVDAGNLNIADPNSTGGPSNWLFVDEFGVHIETNINDANAAPGHSWDFGTDGNLTVPANTVMQTTQTGFPFSSAVVDIVTGQPTVSVLLAGDPFPGPVTGQVTISGVVGTTEANDTWWFQANESDSIELFTDSAFADPVDGTTWTAYENGGFAVSTGSADLEIKGGNVTITSGAWNWTFDATGNLALPGGGSIENRDDLSILITNATVLDGEITLEANAAVNIYGGSTTTSGSSGGRVNVAGGDGGPDDGDAAGNGGEVEITGGTGAPAIDGSAGTGGDVRIIGGSGGAANSGNNLSADTGGQVYISGGQAGDVDGDNTLAVAGPDVEIHGGLGSFNGSTMVGIPGDVIIQGGGNGWIGASGNVLTKTSPDGYDFYVWKYDNAGQTIFPTLSTQRGDTTSGTISGYTIRIGDGAAEAVITTPDGVEGNEYSQRLVINPGAGSNFGEGGDIYLWAGRGGDGSGSGGDIKIRGGQGGANTSGGTGGDGGYIRMEAGDAASVGGYPGFIEITAGEGGAGSPGGYVHILAGTGATGGGEANLTGGYAQNGMGGQVNITGGISADGLGLYGNVVISAGASNWTFDNAGVLLLPNGDIITNGAFNGTASSTVSLNAFSPDGNAVSFQAQGNTSNAVIQTYSDATDTTYSWTFDNAGTTTFPNNTVSTHDDLTIQVSDGIPTGVANWNGGGGWNQGSYIDLATTGGTGTGLTVDVAAGGGGYISINEITIHTPGTGYTNGDVITINNENDIPGTFTITVPTPAWTFATDGSLTVPGISTGSGTGEIQKITGSRRSIGITDDPDFAYAATFAGHSDFGSVAFTASTSLVQSVKVTFAINTNGTAFNWEQFDVSATKFDSANAFVSVSNRVRSNSAIDYTDVSAYVNEGGQLEIWLNPPDGQTVAYVNYDAVEFNLMLN